MTLTKKGKRTIALMFSIIPINELHTLLADVTMNVSPFWFVDKPMDIQWFFKFLFEKIAWCMAGIVFCRLASWNRELRTPGRAFLILTIIDLVMFFGWFNQKYTLLLYSVFSLITILCISTDHTGQEKKRSWLRNDRKQTA